MEDSGVDLLVPTALTVNDLRDAFHSDKSQITIDHKISYCLTRDGVPIPSLLYPRSSISKHNLRMANSVGVIDKGYRGPILAKVDIVDVFRFSTLEDIPGCKARLFQVCAPTLEPIQKVELVEEFTEETLRGEKGIGSTGL